LFDPRLVVPAIEDDGLAELDLVVHRESRRRSAARHVERDAGNLAPHASTLFIAVPADEEASGERLDIDAPFLSERIDIDPCEVGDAVRRNHRGPYAAVLPCDDGGVSVRSDDGPAVARPGDAPVRVRHHAAGARVES